MLELTDAAKASGHVDGPLQMLAEHDLQWPEKISGLSAKRLLDFTAASCALIFLSPLLLAVAVAVRMHDGGPALYGQYRIGLYGKPFKVWKFRSMVVDADKRLQELLDSDPEAAAEWEAHKKLKKDPRITGFGNFIRKSSIDELSAAV